MAEPQWSEDSFYMKEKRKWDTPKRDGGQRCNGFEPFPRMLYRAQQHPRSGKWEVGATQDILSLDKRDVIFDAQEFSRSCQLTVNSEHEYNNARDLGWRDTPAEAMAYHNGLQDDIARAAAERAYSDRNMSEGAKREAAAADAASAEQVPEIPEAPRRRGPGRPRTNAV